jgi:hypothetical protein
MLRLPLPGVKDLFETNNNSMLNFDLPAIQVNLEKLETKKEIFLETKPPLKPLKMKTPTFQNNVRNHLVNDKIYLVPELSANKAKKPIWIFEENVIQNRGRKGKEKEWQKKIKKFYKK